MEEKSKIKIIELKHPVAGITELHIRTEPTFADYWGIRINKGGDTDLKSIGQLIANLSNQPLEVIGKLKNEDWQAVVEEVGVFF